MTKCTYKSLDELPLIITADEVANILSISRVHAYGLMETPDFPTVRVGTRKLVLRDKFIEWLDRQIPDG